MDQTATYTIDTNSASSTEQFAESIGKQLRGSEVIQLIGDVGAGKTTFVRGLVHGIGSTDRVTSPTFTVSNVYDSEKYSLHHYDFYRIDDTKIMKNELAEVLTDKRNIVVLEWAYAVTNVLPKQHINIEISAKSENDRLFKCFIPSKYSYIKVAI